jgi:hypothetical protein
VEHDGLKVGDNPPPRPVALAGRHRLVAVVAVASAAERATVALEAGLVYTLDLPHATFAAALNALPIL